MTPQLRFPEFTDEWRVKRLGDIAEFSKGSSISKNDIHENGKIEAIRYGELYTTYNEIIDEVKSKTSLSPNGLKFSKANDVIIPASGETAIDIATASCVLRDNIALGGDLNIIRTQNNGVFMAYLLNNKKKNDIARLAQGVSVIHLYSSNLKDLVLNLPSKPEQEKIADFLTAVDERIRLQEQKLAKLEQYKRGVMQQIFSQKIRFKDENGNEYPEWGEKKLGSIVKEVNEKTDESNKYETLSSTTKGLFSQREYFNKNIASEDNSGYKILRINQVVFSPQNLWMGNINYNDRFEEGIVSPSYKIFKPVNVVEDFLKQILKTNRMLYEYTQASEQGASIVRRNLDISSFLNIRILLPSLEEQQKIATFLTALDDKITAEKSKLTAAREFKKALLQRMFV